MSLRMVARQRSAVYYKATKPIYFSSCGVFAQMTVRVTEWTVKCFQSEMNTYELLQQVKNTIQKEKTWHLWAFRTECMIFIRNWDPNAHKYDISRLLLWGFGFSLTVHRYGKRLPENFHASSTVVLVTNLTVKFLGTSGRTNADRNEKKRETDICFSQDDKG